MRTALLLAISSLAAARRVAGPAMSPQSLARAAARARGGVRYLSAARGSASGAPALTAERAAAGDNRMQGKQAYAVGSARQGLSTLSGAKRRPPLFQMAEEAVRERNDKQAHEERQGKEGAHSIEDLEREAAWEQSGVFQNFIEKEESDFEHLTGAFEAHQGLEEIRQVRDRMEKVLGEDVASAAIPDCAWSDISDAFLDAVRYQNAHVAAMAALNSLDGISRRQEQFRPEFIMHPEDWATTVIGYTQRLRQIARKHAPADPTSSN